MRARGAGRQAKPPKLRQLWLRLAHAMRASTAGRPPAAGMRGDSLHPEQLRRRLELFARAVTDHPVQVDIEGAPRRRGWIDRAGGLMQGQWRSRARPRVRSDSERVLLPHELPLREGEDVAHALARYRFTVASHAMRIARGSTHELRDMAALEEALYIIREGALAERAVVQRLPKLAAVAAAERRVALASRPALAALSPLDREVEALLREVLAADPRDVTAVLEEDDGPEGSAAWARRTARVMLARAGGVGKLRHVDPVPGWGIVRPSDDPARGTPDADADDGAASPEAGAGTGEQLPPSPDGATPAPDPGATIAAPSAELPLDPIDAASRVVEEPAMPIGGRQLAYPEWDRASARLVAARVLVTETVATGGDAAWADRELADHGALVRGIRARFDRLRARRVTLRGQRDGDALDLAACVQNLVEWRRGLAGDDRLYTAVAPARRPVAITLLVDTSGSTASPVPGSATDHRVIDLEKSSVLLASEALDALGDPFAVLGFSSRGARGVHLRVIKAFGEPHGTTTRARVAAVEPGGNTRLGAAIRHAAALMRVQPVGHRLLLILSDGQPNDADGYVDRQAHDDSRHAVHEARAAGVVTHCLTIDREEPEALAHIFGPAGYTMLTGAEQLPSALLGAVRALLAR